MNSVRVKFVRDEEVKYISHLDLMRTFERAVRRCGIPIAYSEGFNPHPKIVFALPLAVGVTSQGEYADFELSEKMKAEDFAERLNSQLPLGLKIIEAHNKSVKTNIMSEIRFALYNIYVCLSDKMGITHIENLIKELMSKDLVAVNKRTKSGLKEINIRPLIYELKVDSETYMLDECGTQNSSYKLIALLSAGSRGNLKPDLLVEALNHISQSKVELTKIHRMELFIEKDGHILQPFDE